MSTKSVIISTEKKYLVKGNIENPKAIFVVFHGYGQLVEYFSRKFIGLEKDYKLIFPQALSKFYINNLFDKVGASWLTKEDKETEMENNYKYLDEIWKIEFERNLPVKVLGFSQGVSVSVRWLAKNKINFNQLILWAGTFPKDVGYDSFAYLKKSDCAIDFTTGIQDPLYTKERVSTELEKIVKYFSSDVINFHSFDGRHEIDEDLLLKLIK